MEISSNFVPLNPELYSIKRKMESLSNRIQIDSHTQESFPNVIMEIAIFNIPEYEGTDNISSEDDCKVRDSLYRLYFEDLPKVADLGILNLMFLEKKLLI